MTVLFTITLILVNILNIEAVNDDVALNTLQLIAKYGYPLERHLVTTQDGYILEMHRIPYGKTNNVKRIPVLVMHGLGSSSTDFVNHGNKSLGFLLSDRGYDVWLGNSRGNFWSRRHTSLSPDFMKSYYWDFSWNEMGIFDLPACIDYILAKTAQEKLFYICHSQGCTSFFVMASVKSDYNKKIRLFTGLAPTSFMANSKSYFFKTIGNNLRKSQFLYKLLGAYEFLPRSILNDVLGQAVCILSLGLSQICRNILLLIFGYDSTEISQDMVPVIVNSVPAGSATKQIIHFAQGVNSKRFAEFDYGSFKNLLKYGVAEPPSYNLSRITCPIAIHQGPNDIMVTPEDVATLVQNLQPKVIVRRNLVEYAKFNHIDFLWANRVIELVYQYVFEDMEKYSK